MPRSSSGDGRRPVRGNRAGRSPQPAPRSAKRKRAPAGRGGSRSAGGGRGSSRQTPLRRTRRKREVLQLRLPIFRYCGAALVIIGAFLPWIAIGIVSVAGFVSWQGKVAGAVAALAILTTAVMHGSPRRDAVKTARTIAVVAGVICLAVCLLFFNSVINVGNVASISLWSHSDAELSRAGIDRSEGAWGFVGIGLYISLAGCVMLLLAALVEPVIDKRQSRDRMDREHDRYDE